MLQTAYSDAITSAHDELIIEIARTPAQILEAKQLRYKVYCEERGYEPGEGGIEQDVYDGNARHILVRSRVTGAVYGTVRVVLSEDREGALGFPMEQVCESYVLAPLPIATTAEISRFALTRDRTGITPAAAALMRLCLIRGIVEVSGEMGLTHWCATMERTLLRLLRSTAIYFTAVGPVVEYHGIRQPAIWQLSEGFERMRREQPQLWSYLTNNGAFLGHAAPVMNTSDVLAAA